MSGLFDPYANTLTTANDAVLKMGSGPTAITITKSSNTITDVIPGVTLSLMDEATAVSVTVGNDTSDVREKVETFIESLNAAITYYNDNASYDTDNKTAGVLFSESGLRTALAQLKSAFTGSDPSLPSTMRDITALGITIDSKTGTFSLNASTFDEAVAEDPSAVMNLFTNTGASSNNQVQFAYLTEDTDVSNQFTVDITTAAAQAAVGNTGALGVNTVISAANREILININGTAYVALLANGNYTRSELATQVTNAINAVAPNGSKVSVGLDGPGTGLSMRSVLYGDSQTITVIGGTASGTLMLDTAAATGVDVAGTITVNGVTTAATGSGQVLAGAEDTEAEGLRLTVTASAPVAGVTLDVRKGLAQLTGEEFLSMTSADVGLVPLQEDSLEETVKDMTEQIERKDEMFAARRERYLAMFRQMEKLIQGFNSQGSIIASFADQLARSRNS
jgi:flagellar hook-associated protein 2